MLTLLVVLALVGAGIYVAVDQSQSTPKVRLSDTTGTDAGDTIAKLQTLIDNNTR